MSTPNKTNFCPLPFAHATITTNGAYKICCDHRTPFKHTSNINQISFNDWKKSDYVNEVKNSFSNNQRHPGCEQCWAREDVGQLSYRQRITKEYSFFKTTTESDQLVNVEIQLGNLCNLSCLMCGEFFSSAFLAENKRLGINVYEQEDFIWSETAFENLDEILKLQPKILNIRGGEPLYNKRLLDILEKIPEDACKKIMIHITTNATVWPDQWHRVLKKFKLVRFMFSVDAIGELYEYIRFPGNWAMVENNIKQIVKLDNVKAMLHCVVQNLNINNMYELIQWSLEQNIWLEVDQLLHPTYLGLTNLPHDFKTQTLQQLEKCLSMPGLPNHLEKFIQNCQLQLEKALLSPENTELWKTCVDNLTLRDQIRNNSHRKFLNY